jgi:hypothetical protein
MRGGADNIDVIHGALFERHANPGVAAPDRVAAPHELIGLDEQREGLRQTKGIGNVKPRAARGNVSDHAIDAAASAEGEGAVLEHPVSRRHSFLDHCRNSGYVDRPVRLSKRELRVIESNERRIERRVYSSLATMIWGITV